ncbi:MAG: ParB N-terminal domain-containing protein [Candidatus Omnitrophica bacterium]|nr:ParB N-terminal domain-containing protein [Candidatus Omnitrophota bacterium]
MVKKFSIDKNFTPCPVDDGDELYPNGIFEFNITKMFEYIQKNFANIPLETVEVEDFFKDFSSLDESHVDNVDISWPVIIAEISTGRYNLIDGNHRMQKAGRMGVKSMSAYKLNAEQHMKFLITRKGYEAYIEYWNSKLKQ